MSTADASAPLALPVGTITFLFTDIADSTRLWEVEREAMRVSLKRHDTLVRECIRAHRGHVVKTTGDGFHAAFASAPDAVEAALAAQRALLAEPWPEATPIRVRMALHTGAAELRDGDYYGPAVNRAARLAALGHGGQTLLSEITHDLCRDQAPAEVTFTLLGEHSLRGLTRRESVFELRHPALPVAPPLAAPVDSTVPSIAVLPFTDLSSEKDQGYFADGLAEELLNVLSQIRGLRVASRTSAFSFKGSGVDIPTIARKLNVATALEGSVRKAGNRARIATKLIRAATDSLLWSQTYDRELGDIFAIQDDIAQAVVAELRAALLGAKQDTLTSAQVKAEVLVAAKGRGNNADAYQLYLQGRFFVDRFTRDDTARGIEYYRKAVAVDPEYALAWAWLARAYADQAAYAWAPAGTAFERARQAAELALQLNPDLAEGHAALGFVRFAHDRNWRGADASFQRALELAPGNALVLRNAAILAACLGRQSESIALVRRAATLDPLSVPVQHLLGHRCLYAGFLDEAEAAFRKTLELNPQGNFTHYWLGMTHLARGQREEALKEFKQEQNEVFMLLGRTVGEHALGSASEAQAALEKLIDKHADSGAFQIAEGYARLGDADRAFEWLERADAMGDPGLVEVKATVHLRGLHNDDRWPKFLARVGLAD
jgi:TolB-like protein/class 3 adenylate cyclase/Tfp pilus assembly protein PilF